LDKLVKQIWTYFLSTHIMSQIFVGNSSTIRST